MKIIDSEDYRFIAKWDAKSDCENVFNIIIDFTLLYQLK